MSQLPSHYGILAHMPITRLSLLGAPLFYYNDQPVALNIAKMQALLAYLAVTRLPQPREHLLALLWAESGADAARKNMRNRLWQTRQLLGEDVVISQGQGLLLAPGVWTDVAQFEMSLPAQLRADSPDPVILDELLQLWRGPLLEGITLAEAPEFELWLTTERERLGQLYTQGLDALINRQRQLDGWTQIVALAQRGMQHDPLHEPFHQALMRAYASQGERTAALRQYDQLHALLAQELGVEPLPESQALRATIAKHELATQLPPRKDAVVAPLVMPGVNRYATPFVGRQAELETLNGVWQQAGAGSCKVLLLSGELGIGKSTLWRQWAATLPAEQVVLETRCLNTTQHLPFDPMRRLLGMPYCLEKMAQVAERLLPAWRAELVHLAPVLEAVLAPNAGQRATPMALTPTEERALIAEALTQFLRAFDAAPLVLFVDDLHWADGATLDWLLYLTDRMAHEALLLVGAYRPEDAGTGLNRLMAQWQREGLLTRMELPKFTVEETAALLTHLGSSATMAHHLRTQSGGNPFYLTQLSDMAVDGIPASLAEIVQARLSYLAADEQPILQAAAVLEPAIDLLLLQQTSGRSEEETIDALDGLLAAALLVEKESGYEFAHPLVATVVRNGLSSGRRKLLHRRAGDGLAARHANQLVAVSGQLAHHYSEADEPEKALYFADMAGAEALRIGAAAEALTFYTQAQSRRPSPHRQLEMGMALQLLPSKLSEARELMQQALETFESEENLQGVVKAGLRLAGSYLGTQEGANVLHWARRVLPDLELVEDVTLHASAHNLMGTAKFRSGYDMDEADAHFQQATELVKAYSIDTEIGLMSWFEWGNLSLERGDIQTAIVKFQQAQKIAQSQQSLLFETLSLNNLAYATLLNGNVTKAQELIEQALSLTDTYALQPMRYYLLSTKGEVALANQEPDAAEALFTQAVSLAHKYDNPTFVANLQAHLGRVAHLRGDLEEALALLERAQKAVADGNTFYLQCQIALWLTEIQLERGDGGAAATHLQEAQVGLRARHYQLLQAKADQLQKRVHGSAASIPVASDLESTV